MFSELRWEVIVCFVDFGGIDDHYCVNFPFASSELRWEVIVFYVDIGGIDDNYCISFLCCVQWVKMKGDCLFCWYWWNWWPLLCKLSFFVSNELRWEVIVCCVDIGGIDDHYCLHFLFCVQWVKIRDACLFCWYWWNWWPLLFKPSFLLTELR